MGNLAKLLAAYCVGLVLGMLVVMPGLFALLSLLLDYSIIGLVAPLAVVLAAVVLGVVGKLPDGPAK